MTSSHRFRPANIGQLQQVVAHAVAEGMSLDVRGHGSKAGLGRPTEAAGCLDTSGLAGIDMYEPDELVMSAGAGTPLADIEAALAEKGQVLAFEPADYGLILGGPAGCQTIGGVFAANLSGPGRIRSGAARDHLLGLQLVTGHGQIIKTGGRVVKNVTGYDLCKLLSGSMGTLAVMSHVTFKVLPAAETSGTLVLCGNDETVLLQCLRAAMGSPFDVSGAAMLPASAAARSAVGEVAAAGQSLALVRVEGPSPSVDYRVDELKKLLAGNIVEFGLLDHASGSAIWKEIRDVRLLPTDGPLWRVSVAPTAALDAAGSTGARIFDGSGGVIWLAGDEDGMVRQRAIAAGGHAMLVRGSGDLRLRIPPFQPQPEALHRLSQRVKNSFDPRHVLNAGRMYEGI
ncbi:MAG: FAD-binding protein [Geminicoccaceae bacterium]|nr:FAD-binding protein [Geminicoccaceae bacterium]